MAKDPQVGYQVTAQITHVKGHCNAGHKAGDTFNISCHNPGECCGFFYHLIFGNLETLQFGGQCPWWEGDTIEVQCADPVNTVSMNLTRKAR